MIQEPVLCTDEGFFGPDSISWRVSGPTMVPALISTGVMFFLSPQNAAIGMANTDALANPWDRIVQTADYAYAIFFGDKETATHAANIVNAVHDHVRGTWAPTGDRVHVASEPHNLMWLLIPFANALLDAYDAYGPKSLTAEDRDRVWRDEVTVIGELNRIPLDMMPKSQAEVAEYFESQRPFLAMTAAAQAAINLIFPSLIRGDGPLPPVAVLPARLLAAAGVALVPDYALQILLRRPYSRSEKWAIRAAARPVYAPLCALPASRDLLPRLISPACRAVVEKARTNAKTGVYDGPRAATAKRTASSRSRPNGNVAQLT
jgi:uncharacterized protein (DUF2236 family)